MKQALPESVINQILTCTRQNTLLNQKQDPRASTTQISQIITLSQHMTKHSEISPKRIPIATNKQRAQKNTTTSLPTRLN